MAFRSSDTQGSAHIPVNAALVGFRIVPGMDITDALEVYTIAEQQNEYAAAVRRHPSWNTALENDLRYRPDPEWSTSEVRFAREVLRRVASVYGRTNGPQVTRQRSDGRYEVADHADGMPLYCQLDDWCILETGHPGECNGDRELWLGPDVLYPPVLANA